MKMNFTDFLYDVFTLKSYETKSYTERERERGGRVGGRDTERENELVSELAESTFHKTRVTQRKCSTKMEDYWQADGEAAREHLQGAAWPWRSTSEQDRHCPL